MARDFVQPYRQLEGQDHFGAQEVGITHPRRASHVRLHDNGDVEVTACEGLSIIMHPANRSVTFVADRVKFLTQEEDGLQWNKMSFNKDAHKFEQPTFVQVSDEQTAASGIYRGVGHFLEPDPAKEKGPEDATRDGEVPKGPNAHASDVAKAVTAADKTGEARSTAARTANGSLEKSQQKETNPSSTKKRKI